GRSVVHLSVSQRFSRGLGLLDWTEDSRAAIHHPKPRQRFNRLERQQINYNKKQVCYQTTYVEPPLRQNHLSQPPSEFMGASESGTSVTRDKLVKTRRSQHDGRLWIQVYPGVVLEDGNADKDAEKLRQARTFMSSRRNLLQICGLYGFLYSCFRYLLDEFILDKADVSDQTSFTPDVHGFFSTTSSLPLTHFEWVARLPCVST
ncbi:hypothetical protein L210DRAFT_334440, partial [Boletus edulis BED1]